jgi:predicted phosphodiesterase
MTKLTNKKADCVFTADFHLRDDVPECRDKQEFFSARNFKIQWLRDLQKRHDCPIIDAGDVFNKWNVSSELEGWALLNLPTGIITVPGNHDLPNHNVGLYRKSSLHVLEAAKKVRVLNGNDMGKGNWQTQNGITFIGFPFGDEFYSIDKKEGEQSIAIVHAYVAETVPPFIEGYTPAQLLAALPGYDVIVSGHNHAAFDYKNKTGRLVVNPGSMMRMAADQEDHRPGVYLWYAYDNTVERVDYPFEPGVVSRNHLARQEERDERMIAFVDRLNTDVDISLSFEQNMDKFFVTNKTDKRTQELVREAINGK